MLFNRAESEADVPELDLIREAVCKPITLTCQTYAVSNFLHRQIYGMSKLERLGHSQLATLCLPRPEMILNPAKRNFESVAPQNLVQTYQFKADTAMYAPTIMHVSQPIFRVEKVSRDSNNPLAGSSGFAPNHMKRKVFPKGHFANHQRGSSTNIKKDALWKPLLR